MTDVEFDDPTYRAITPRLAEMMLVHADQEKVQALLRQDYIALSMRRALFVGSVLHKSDLYSLSLPRSVCELCSIDPPQVIWETLQDNELVDRLVALSSHPQRMFRSFGL